MQPLRTLQSVVEKWKKTVRFRMRIPHIWGDIRKQVAELLRIWTPQQRPAPQQEVDQSDTLALAEPQQRCISPIPRQEDLQSKLDRYLQARGLIIVEFLPNRENNPTLCQRRHLARFMVEHCSEVFPLISHLRPTLQSPKRVRYPLHNASPEQINILTNVGSRLYQLYMLELYEYNRLVREILLRVRNQPFAHNFLSGHWFELGVGEFVRRWLNQAGYPHFVYQNLKLQCRGGASLEVDLLIGVLVQGELRIILLECKSGLDLTDEEIDQIGRATRLLNLNWMRSAVVMPRQPNPPTAELWTNKTNASFISIFQLGSFLSDSLRLAKERQGDNWGL